MFLTCEDQIKLGDFGNARLYQPDSEQIISTYIGTIPYMSPEMQNFQNRKYSPTTDIWLAN